MKKFLVFLIFVGGAVAAYWFYDPYLKPYVGPLIEKFVGGELPEPAPGEEKKVADSPAPTMPLPEKSDGKETPTAPNQPKPATGTATNPATKPASSMSEIDQLVAERYPIPEFVPLVQIVGNWQNIPQRAFPEQVAIQDKVPFSLRDSSGKVIGASVAVPGTLVKPVRLNGDTLLVASLANESMRSEISVEKTDLKERIQKRYNDFVLNMTNRIREQREKAKQALLAKPEALAALKGGGSFDQSGDARFAPVKASIANGDIKAFDPDEAMGFRWNGSEKINGDIYKGTYDTVTVKYEARTIFGVFPGEAKCLLQNGKVIGWVDPITEDEMI
ncbi:MAG: hypothetical protein KDN19_08720 [Verrucomicrobiae bacterium]|nr:hypothetical protein [Verrucomicrobiae bacterium]